MMSDPHRHSRLSRISALHYAKLLCRSAFFLIAVASYIVAKCRGRVAYELPDGKVVWLLLVWAVFAVEMVFRFFPSTLESMGCQKQFAQNYLPAKNENVKQGKKQSARSIVTIAFLWLFLNAIIGALYYGRVIDKGVLLLVSLAYSVCDMVCILFFCPFQTWFMKNKCCGSCRIYNWDFAMMFTPLLFIKSVYTWSLLTLALVLLVKWEVIYHRHPERFSEATNKSLSCSRCNEKLCRHKKQLQHFLMAWIAVQKTNGSDKFDY